jgi:pyruvate-formate lyase-activating enzyme
LKKNSNIPLLVVSDTKGNILEIPELVMAAFSAGKFTVPESSDIIPVPMGSVFFTLPGRTVVGYDPSKNEFVTVEKYGNKTVFPVAAFMPPGYIRTLHCAYHERKNSPGLPLYCYSATGWTNGTFYVAGSRIDRRKRHEIFDDDFPYIDRLARRMLTMFKGNRLVGHLMNNCVLKYRCPNACNLVLSRWECPVPVSTACNAECIGCISRQKSSSGFPSSQDRIDFTPTVDEILDYVIPHIKTAPEPIISFGQGCEGEPLLEAALLRETITEIRRSSRRGIINLNTNASLPHEVEKLCMAGLDSMRVSLNSAQHAYYKAYYRPHGYSLENVIESIKIAKRFNVWISLNYLVFPGFTDHPDEIRSLLKLIKEYRIDMIQTRNLCIDPHLLNNKMRMSELTGQTGMVEWIELIKKAAPWLKLGYYNPTCRTIKSCRGLRI